MPPPRSRTQASGSSTDNTSRSPRLPAPSSPYVQRASVQGAADTPPSRRTRRHQGPVGWSSPSASTRPVRPGRAHPRDSLRRLDVDRGPAAGGTRPRRDVRAAHVGEWTVPLTGSERANQPVTAPARRRTVPGGSATRRGARPGTSPRPGPDGPPSGPTPTPSVELGPSGRDDLPCAVAAKADLREQQPGECQPDVDVHVRAVARDHPDPEPAASTCRCARAEVVPHRR